MTESKSDLYRRQTEQAHRSILKDWPTWQRRNAGYPKKPKDGSPDERLRYAVEVVLDEARRGGEHTPHGHACEICVSMSTVIEWLVTGKP